MNAVPATLPSAAGESIEGAGGTLLHDLGTLTVGDLVFEIAPPSDRKTIEIIVERDASLVLKAPCAVTVDRAERFVIAKRPLGVSQVG